MSKVRFKELGSGSFFGDYLYEHIVPKDHFLRRLDEVVEWEVFGASLVQLYAGGAKRGRAPYNPVVILKLLVLAFLYNLSERQTERFANDSLSVQWFLGLAVDEAAPDHTTLTEFKERIEKRAKERLLEELLIAVLVMAKSRGVGFGSIQVVDSTHTVANVNVAKGDRRHREGQSRRDSQARWGVKGKGRMTWVCRRVT